MIYPRIDYVFLPKCYIYTAVIKSQFTRDPWNWDSESGFLRMAPRCNRYEKCNTLFWRESSRLLRPPCIDYMQYPWGYALPVSQIISIHESYPQYPWGYAVPMTVCSTREDMQYPWGKFHSFFIHINLLTGTEDMVHRYWGYDSRVLHTLTGTEDVTHRYWWYDSRVLHILTGTEDMTHGYWGYDSRVLHILTGTEDMTHGYWRYDSQVMHILTGTAYSLYRVKAVFSTRKRFWIKQLYRVNKKRRKTNHTTSSLLESLRLDILFLLILIPHDLYTAMWSVQYYKHLRGSKERK